MEAGLRTPLLDFFRRGEVARDVRMMAAQGAIAPRPLEQLGLLMILTADADSEVRATAEATLGMLPTELIAGFIARADVPTELREFFIKRGIQPSDTPAPDMEEPLVDTDKSDLGLDLPEGEGEGKALTFTQRLPDMTVPEKVKCAMKGTREMRAVLIRDANRMVASAVLSCPKVNDAEVETFAKMGNVSEDILRTIATTRAWTKNYGVTLSLVKNSKTPVALSMNLMNRLTESDVKKIASDRNVPEALRLAARKRAVSNLK
ncbi:MAG: hypothetical protein A3J29_10100 [Acidobacteria bacterium RIFCSPLOWO2_12_FULL_67_14b]|nr:MAG: hypothetical protein A3J29_10100 [Acidobacteria bacterium RIFCSPLOWO2_12_FULL_67_14b]